VVWRFDVVGRGEGAKAGVRRKRCGRENFGCGNFGREGSMNYPWFLTK
jgi:hypothetical protein